MEKTMSPTRKIFMSIVILTFLSACSYSGKLDLETTKQTNFPQTSLLDYCKKQETKYFSNSTTNSLTVLLGASLGVSINPENFCHDIGVMDRMTKVQMPTFSDLQGNSDGCTEPEKIVTLTRLKLRHESLEKFLTTTRENSEGLNKITAVNCKPTADAILAYFQIKYGFPILKKCFDSYKISNKLLDINQVKNLQNIFLPSFAENTCVLPLDNNLAAMQKEINVQEMSFTCATENLK